MTFALVVLDQALLLISKLVLYLHKNCYVKYLLLFFLWPSQKSLTLRIYLNGASSLLLNVSVIPGPRDARKLSMQPSSVCLSFLGWSEDEDMRSDMFLFFNWRNFFWSLTENLAGHWLKVCLRRLTK